MGAKRTQPVMQPTHYYSVRNYTIKRSGEALILEDENVFKIAVTRALSPCVSCQIVLESVRFLKRI